MTESVGRIAEGDTPWEGGYITKVHPSKDAGGYEIAFDESPDAEHRMTGTHFYISPDNNPNGIEPKLGQKVEFFGAGRFQTVRGVQLDGTLVYYRTEDEQKALYETETYGKDAAELLERWDAGRSVWSIELGAPGLGRMGPCYEMATQILMFEMLRTMLDPTVEFSDETMNSNRRAMAIGPSGSQWAVAKSLALAFFEHGPIEVMRKAHDDRKMQISANPPSVKALDEWIAENPAEEELPGG